MAGFLLTKNMSKSPAFQFYAADFMIGIMGMTDEEVGIYIKMLSTQWLHGSLPNCKKTIKKMINSRKVPSEMVMRKFSISDDGFLRNERMEKVREKQKSFAETRKENANKRWNKSENEDALAMHVHDGSICKTDALHLQSSSSSSTSSINNTYTPTKEAACVIESPFLDCPPEASLTMHQIMDKINELRPAWKRVPRWNRNEMESLRNGSASQIESLTDDDWNLLKAFYAAPDDKAWFKFEQRHKFCENLSSTLATADKWKNATGYRAPNSRDSLYYGS